MKTVSRLRPAELEDIRQRIGAAVRRVCPTWLADSAEDLVQVALIKTIDAVKKSEENREISSSYLWKVAYCAVVDEIRRHRRRREVALEDETEANGAMATAPDPEHALSARMTGRAIMTCLEELAESRRLAVTLHLAGHGIGEIAQLLGWKPKRADNLVYRGLADLRKCLQTRGFRP